MAVITVTFGDEVYLRVRSEKIVEKHLAEFFCFNTPLRQFRREDIPDKEWDGIYRLYRNKYLLAGLYPSLEDFAKLYGHKIEKQHYPIGKDGNPVLDDSIIVDSTPRVISSPKSKEGKLKLEEEIRNEAKRREYLMEEYGDPKFFTCFPVDEDEYPLATEINEKEFRKWMNGLQYKSSKPREYEITPMLNALRKNRAVLWFPDGNKHPVLYYLLQWFLKKKKKCLLVAWDTGAVKGLYERFESEHVQKLHNRLTKNVKKPILIAGWQSIYRQPIEWFDQFDAVIVDEIDKFSARTSKSRSKFLKNRITQLQSLMEKITKAKYRMGITEWQGKPKIHPMALKGLFGMGEKIRDETAAKDHQSTLNVTRIEFNYPNEIREKAKKRTREQEIRFLEQYEGRNHYIRNLVCSLEGNILVIVKKLSHGNALYELIREKLEQDGLKKEVYMNSRSTKDEWIVIATYQKVHYGLPLDCLDNVLLSHPYKNDIRNLKSIGANLEARNADCNLYDLVDDLSLNDRENHLIKEANRRLKAYQEQELPVKNVRVDMK